METDLSGDNYDFGARIYDARLGRFLSIDTKWQQYPEMSPYSYALNNPIRLIDNNGEGATDPLHHKFLTTVAIDIYDAAKARGASGRGALLVMAQASLESKYGQDAMRRGDYNLFGVMTGGTDYKVSNSHGKIRDYSKVGGYSASITDYFSKKTKKWPMADELIKKDAFTSDDIDQAFYTGSYYENDATRNKTGHYSYNADNVDVNGVNKNKYGESLLKQMADFKTRLIKSIDYQVEKNDAQISSIDKEISDLKSQNISSIGGLVPSTSATVGKFDFKIAILEIKKEILEKENAKLKEVKEDVSK